MAMLPDRRSIGCWLESLAWAPLALLQISMASSNGMAWCLARADFSSRMKLNADIELTAYRILQSLTSGSKCRPS